MYGLGMGLYAQSKPGLWHTVGTHTHAHTGTHTDKPQQHILQEGSFAWAPISVWDLGTMPSTVAATS